MSALHVAAARISASVFIATGFFSHGDFPNGFILLPVGFFLLLLTLHPRHVIAVRCSHVPLLGFLGGGQLAHLLYVRKSLDRCAEAHPLVCLRVAGHTAIAVCMGVLMLACVPLACCVREGQLRRLWKLSRLAFAGIALNNMWCLFATLFSTIAPDLVFPDDRLFGFLVYPSPPVRDLAFLVTTLVWLGCVAIVAPRYRGRLRSILQLPSVDEEEAKPGPLL